jgi:4-amino-4-deoxy-L-arabinose transferase-like glycosyltransferase
MMPMRNPWAVTLGDIFTMSGKNKFLTIMNAILTILGGYRMVSLIVAPTWWEQWIWEMVIIISGGFSIGYFAERRVHEQREKYER